MAGRGCCCGGLRGSGSGGLGDSVGGSTVYRGVRDEGVAVANRGEAGRWGDGEWEGGWEWVEGREAGGELRFELGLGGRIGAGGWVWVWDGEVVSVLWSTRAATRKKTVG